MRGSDKFKNDSGPNPFSESQARAFGGSKAAAEFFPTSSFWSCFNEQHEILLGTRGSGKTIILKMLSYSNLKRLSSEHPMAQQIIESKSFIGIYIPLHLEFMASMGTKCNDDEKREYFQFSFNCAAVESLIIELSSLLEDIEDDITNKLIIENKITKSLAEIWFPDKKNSLNLFKDISWAIKVLYQQQQFWMDGEGQPNSSLAAPLLSPIKAVLPKVSDYLGLDISSTNWLICIDEAEFLSEPLLECINSVLRSEKRPIVIKMATLPFKHSTRKTLTPNVQVEPNGNDFNYRYLKLTGDNKDFSNLVDHICKVRFKQCNKDIRTLEEFIGIEGKDEWLDYFRLEMGVEESSEENILEGILSSISPKRRARYEKNSISPTRTLRKEYFNRFSPVYYVRRMKQENSRGNRTVGWFAGSNVIKNVADGNPRRFIQLMHDLVQEARTKPLKPKTQHKVIVDFCHRTYDLTGGLPQYGPIVKEIINDIGNQLSERVHGLDMVDSGCGFRISETLLKKGQFLKALHMAIAYSHIYFDSGEIEDITAKSDLRLSYLYAVEYWLPMRKGEPCVLKTIDELPCEILANGEIDTEIESKRYVKSLQLTLFEVNNE